jgi:hypothetical protein
VRVILDRVLALERKLQFALIEDGPLKLKKAARSPASRRRRSLSPKRAKPKPPEEKPRAPAASASSPRKAVAANSRRWLGTENYPLQSIQELFRQWHTWFLRTQQEGDGGPRRAALRLRVWSEDLQERLKGRLGRVGERQKMLLNEYRLQPWTPQAQSFLVEQMQEFFFGDGAALPAEYVPPARRNPPQRSAEPQARVN